MEPLLDTPIRRDLIYDVGTHKGEDAEFYLRKGFRVVAIEADPDLAAFCRNRLHEFLVAGKLTIVEGAVVDPDSLVSGQTKTQFYKSNRISVWGTTRPDWAERFARLGAGSHMIEVNVVDFLAVMQQHGVPHYMKIDIEGCDMVCLQALRRFKERPDYVSLESDKTSYGNIKHEINALGDLGYDRFQAVEQSGIPSSQHPPYPAKEGRYVDQVFEQGSSGLFGAELGNEWKSRREILHQYRYIRLGYFLLGDDGAMNRWNFQAAPKWRSWIQSHLSGLTGGDVPGWHDVHARHASAAFPREGTVAKV